jgi:hypothetical protein
MTSPIQPLSISEKAFARTFVRDFSSPYAIQQPEGRRADWRTKYKPVSDPLIHAHLAQDYWLGTKAPWYPIFFNLDIDRPTKKTLETISSRLDSFGIGEDQRALMTTPSHSKYGNFRIYLRLEYADRLPTWKLGYDALNAAFGDACEVYPQKRRKDRLPCGRAQDLIAEDGRILNNLTWEDELHFLMKLDPVPIEQLPRQVQLEFPEFSPRSDDAPKAWKPRTAAAELMQNGLQQDGTRNRAQFIVLNDLWRSNFQPGDAAARVKTWIRRHHNGFSTTAAQGRWKDINNEIDRQIKSIWSRPQTLLPDTPHGLNAAIVKADLQLGAELFRGDAVRQKQFINLAAYIRPRQHHEWVFIPRHVWSDKVASKDTYKKFIGELESKGMLQSNNSYRVGHYSKRFKLMLPKTSEQPISFDGRNTTDFYDALWQAYNSIKDVADVTGLNAMTIWRKYQQE